MFHLVDINTRAITAVCAVALGFATLSAASISKGDPAGDPVLKPATFQKIYVPAGFDSNDHIQIVGEGLFNNTCYRPAPTTVHIDENMHQVLIGPVAYEYPGFCTQVILPFQRTIDIGLLKAGVWEVVQQADGTKLGSINVKPATTAMADDFDYAPISQAFFQKDAHSARILLTGHFLSSCMSLEDVKLSVETDVIVVQPIVKIEERNDCVEDQFPFSTWVALDFLKPQRYLIHVRSMNGNAINNLIDVP